MRLFIRIEVAGSPARLRISVEKNASGSDTPEHAQNGENMYKVVSDRIVGMMELYNHRFKRISNLRPIAERAARLVLVYRPAKREKTGHWELQVPHEALTNGFSVRTMHVLPLIVWAYANYPFVRLSDDAAAFLSMHNLFVGGSLVGREELLRQMDIEEKEVQ